MTGMISTARRRELGAELRRLRERLGLKGQDMAARLHWTPTRLSRVETGKLATTQFDVLRYLMLCDLSPEEQDVLLRLAVEPDDYRLKPHPGKLPDELRTLIFHESTASTIESFQPIYLPGITQTEDYARALFREGDILEPEEIESRVEVRVGRRDVLTRFDPALCTFYVHENAFRLPIGGPWVMHEQMLHLLFASSRPQCSIRVIPLTAGGRGMCASAFQVFGYLEGSPVVYVQHETTSEFLESREELAYHRSILNRVASVALNDAQSREFIAWMASEYEQQGAAQDGSGPGVAQEQL